MSPHRDEHLELCAGLVLGSLSDADRSALETHLSEGCPVCEAELRSLADGARTLAASAPRHRAPAAVRARVLAAVGAEAMGPAAAKGAREREARPAAVLELPRRRAPLQWAWAAAAVTVAVSVLISWRAMDRLRGELAATRGEVAQLQHQLEEEQRWVAMLSAPQTRVVELAATPAAGQVPVARVTYDPGSRRALVVCDHLAVPPGKDYQLWAITKEGPNSLGLLRADASGRAVVRLEDAGDPATLGAFAISLENQGGAPTAHAPAGPVVLVGKLAGS